MKKEKVPLLVFLVLAYGTLMLQTFSLSGSAAPFVAKAITHAEPEDLKKEALAVLQTKCNVCHRKQNPFKIFKEKNMERLAPKIYEQVFIKKRMPKAGQTLTDEERNTLKQWLLTQKTNKNGNDQKHLILRNTDARGTVGRTILLVGSFRTTRHQQGFQL